MLIVYVLCCLQMKYYEMCLLLFSNEYIQNCTHYSYYFLHKERIVYDIKF